MPAPTGCWQIDRGGAADPPRRGADPGGRARRADRAADDARRASQRPCRPDRVSRRQDRLRPTLRRSTPRCARPRRRSGSTGRFVDPIGYLDLYATGFGFRILPTVARVQARLRTHHQHIGSRRRLRGAAVVPDGSGQSPVAQQGIPRRASAPTTRCRSPNATSGARPRASCACCMNGFTCHDPSRSDRNRDLPDPVRALRGLS